MFAYQEEQAWVSSMEKNMIQSFSDQIECNFILFIEDTDLSM
jgi:hypothetical protein